MDLYRDENLIALMQLNPLLSREALSDVWQELHYWIPINDAKPPPKSTGVCHTNEAYFAALAFSHRAVNALGSSMANSESTLRLISMPATFRPLISLE